MHAVHVRRTGAMLAGQLAAVHAQAHPDRRVRVGRPPPGIHVARQIAQGDHRKVVPGQVVDEALEQRRRGAAERVVVRHAVQADHRDPAVARGRYRRAQIVQVHRGAADGGDRYQQRMVLPRRVGTSEGAVRVIDVLGRAAAAREQVAGVVQRLDGRTAVMASRIAVGDRLGDAVRGAALLHVAQIAHELLARLRVDRHVPAVVVADLEAGVVQPADLAPVQESALVLEPQPLGDVEGGAESVPREQRPYQLDVGPAAVVEREDDQSIGNGVHGASGSACAPAVWHGSLVPSTIRRQASAS